MSERNVNLIRVIMLKPGNATQLRQHDFPFSYITTCINNLIRMKKQIIILACLGLILTSCLEDQFEPLPLLDNILVVLNTPLQKETEVDISGSFQIANLEGFDVDKEVKYGLMLMADSPSSGEVMVEQVEYSATLNALVPFSDQNIEIPTFTFDQPETGVTYSAQAFVDIAGTPFMSNTVDFSYSWLPRSSLQQVGIPQRADALTISEQDRVFILGGRTRLQTLTDIWMISQSEVNQLGSLPPAFTVLNEWVGFTVEGKLYVGLGKNQFGEPSGTFWSTQLTDSPLLWNTTTPFPDARSGAVAFSVDNRAFVGLGNNDARFFNDLYEYLPASDEWTRLDISNANQMAGRTNAVSFVVGSTLFVGLGDSGNGLLADFWSLDLSQANLTWQAVGSPFPSGGRSNATALSLGDKIAIGLGRTENSLQQDFYLFDPISQSWSNFPVFPGGIRKGIVGYSLNEKGFIGMGFDEGEINIFNDFWEFDTN